MSLRFNSFAIDWQEYLIDWVAQNAWLEELAILGTGFRQDTKGRLKAAWRSHLTSHRTDESDNTLFRTDLDYLRFNDIGNTKKSSPCPFCLSDLAAENSAKAAGNSSRMLKHKQLANIVRLQAFCRMVTARARYRRGRKVIVGLQRKYRAGVSSLISFSRIIISYHNLILSSHVIILYHHLIPSLRIIISSHQLISSSHVIILYHHLIPSSHTIISYHHPVSSPRIIISYHPVSSSRMNHHPVSSSRIIISYHHLVSSSS